MDLVSRLKQYLDSRQVSVTQFADECGIPRPTASQLLAGRNKKVSDEIIGKIHQCYPDLNVIWLMFGEGNMVTGENIGFSGPQNTGFFDYPATQATDVEHDGHIEPIRENTHQNPPEKSVDETMTERTGYTQNPEPAIGGEFSFSSAQTAAPQSSTFTFSSPSLATPPAPSRSSVQHPTGQPLQNQEQPPRPITFMPGKGKRVTGIVVYYDDCTYESFIPDPDHSTSFLR